MTDKKNAEAELTELARGAAWGLAKGGHLDGWEDGKAALRLRLDIIEAAERAGIHQDFSDDGEGIGEMYTRADLDE